MPYSSNVCSALTIISFLASIAFSARPSSTAGQETVESSRPPILASNDIDGAYVPAHILLQQADALYPPRPDGWIVSESPVNAWQMAMDPAKQTYERFEYPLRLRQYDSQIRVAQALVNSWRRRLREYRYFNKANALFIANENAILAYIQAEENLRNLRYERMLFEREHQWQGRLLPSEIVISDEVVGAFD